MTDLTIKTNHGKLKATLNTPKNSAAALLLAHGAGADHKHAHMESLASAFGQAGITTLRFNFPFKEQGRNRVDSRQVSIDCICDAAEVLRCRTGNPVFVGGHSFGGRMVSHAVAEDLLPCKGLVLCSFPLHPAGKPGIERAAHFGDIKKPVLFLSGTRDALANVDLLDSCADALPAKKLHWLETADHSYKILKRSRRNTVDVYTEAASVAAEFIAEHNA